MSRDDGWLLRLWAVAAAFLAIGIARSIAVGIPFRDPGGEYLTVKIAISAGVFVAQAVVDGVRRTSRARRRSPAAVLATLRSRWPRGRLLRAAAVLLAYHLVYFTYHNLKSWDVLLTPRDSTLSAVDRWLFLGHAPAVLLHDLLGQGVAAWVLIAIYESFPTLVTVAVVAVVVFPETVRDGAVGIAALCWTWILGTATYYLVPSLGPFHDRPQDFAGLPHSIVTDTQARYLAQRAHLLADPGAHDAFAQVSAFASLHVGMTTLLLLLASYYRLRRLTVALAIYLAGTVVATVYLGWHFAVDDVAGVVIAVAGFHLGRLTIGRRARAPQESMMVP